MVGNLVDDAVAFSSRGSCRFGALGSESERLGEFLQAEDWDEKHSLDQGRQFGGISEPRRFARETDGRLSLRTSTYSTFLLHECWAFLSFNAHSLFATRLGVSTPRGPLELLVSMFN